MRFISNLSGRDRKALVALAVFFIAILLVWCVQASFGYRTEAQSTFRENRLFLMDLYSYGKKISMLEASTKSNIQAVSDQALLTIASSSAKDKNLAFKRFQPDGDNSLQLWLEDVNFNVMLWWLSDMENKQGIRVAQITVERTKKDGFVNARITLMR